MSIGKALRLRAAMNKVNKKANMIDVGIGVLTLASLFIGTKTTKKKPKNSKKWGHKGY